MNKLETAKLLAVVKMAYSNFEVTEERIRVWHEFMQEITFDEAQKNLKIHIRKSAFPPAISEIMNPPQPKSSQHEKNMQVLEDYFWKPLLDEFLRNWCGDGEPPIKELREAFERGDSEEFMQEQLQLPNGKDG